MPTRLTQKLFVIERLSDWYAERVDAKSVGEAILTEFVAD